MRARLVVALLWLFSRFPLRVSHAMGAVIGRVVYWWPGAFREVAATNIGLCFPHLSAVEQKVLLRACLMETGKAAAELGTLWFWKPQRVLALVRAVEGEQLVEQAIRAGRGVILAAPHFGAWELLGVYCASRWPMTNLYQPPHLQGLEKTMRASRVRYGANMVPTTGAGVRGLLKALKQGRLVGILPDQEPDRESGVFAPFYGVPALTMTLLSRLAQKAGAEVIFTGAVRLKDGQGYRVFFQAAPAGIAAQDVVAAAGCLNRGVEQCIQHAPAQYQWAYKRFRRRPSGEKRFY